MSKTNFFQKKEQTRFPSGHIEGFDIELNQENKRRIDRLVDHYENSILAHLDEAYQKKTSWSDRLADRIASFGGSWTFIVYFACFLIVWIVWNSLPFTRLRFDAPPFILLNLCLSFIAAFQAPVIMMSQNRQASRDKHESIIDFAINYKAEQEIDDMQSHLHRIEEELIELKKLLLANAKSKKE
ncbi:hypothetical protein CDO73_25985 [Saccharibacillus sp. O23]|uniref:DUF1003 domain-containing protein n=1 Tax=Saccharibacillus sp. O23 TaxID=2009338 RepID=UPI000B4DFE82|nr:DUF1003 domain-containing protein [Saccharibacillus sp. O23]OWR26546.1 hypothetical protein CDO73_25985 [Saccharibacillus sp. O23]